MQCVHEGSSICSVTSSSSPSHRQLCARCSIDGAVELYKRGKSVSVRTEKHSSSSGTHPSQWRASARGLQIVNVETGSPSVLRETARATHNTCARHIHLKGYRTTPQFLPESGTHIFCEKHEEKPFGQKGENFMQMCKG